MLEQPSERSLEVRRTFLSTPIDEKQVEKIKVDPRVSPYRTFIPDILPNQLLVLEGGLTPITNPILIAPSFYVCIPLFFKASTGEKFFTHVNVKKLRQHIDRHADNGLQRFGLYNEVRIIQADMIEVQSEEDYDDEVRRNIETTSAFLTAILKVDKKNVNVHPIPHPGEVFDIWSLGYDIQMVDNQVCAFGQRSELGFVVPVAPVIKSLI
jgi:hypothetical protein